MTWFYRRLGRHYPLAFVAVELYSALLITVGAIAFFSLYYEGDALEWGAVLGVAIAFTLLASTVALAKLAPRLRPLRRWIAGDRDAEATARAWSVAAGLPLELVHRDVLLPVLLSALPISASIPLILGLSWLAFFPIVAGSLVVVIYAGILHHFATEIGMRPVLIDMNREVSPRFATQVRALSIRARLMAALPLINIITGLIVAGLTSPGGGGAALGVDVLIAVAVATTVSLELAYLLSRSIVGQLLDLQRATAAVREGELSVRVPVTTGDELGELAASFNQMVRGLAERERLREAFGAYVDHSVADYILGEEFSEAGVEREVSVLFCDVRSFSEYAAERDARAVVRTLNGMFEQIVPVISAHGGHVDKFEGDGLIAVFGAPRPDPDHASRAVRAACEIARRVNGPQAGGELEVGVGVNTGRVVAGNIGGGGRVNFRVIGEPVNLASRVEAETRRTGEDVLITEATKSRLGDEFELSPIGERELKGVERPVPLFAPRPSTERDGPTLPAPTHEQAPHRATGRV